MHFSFHLLLLPGCHAARYMVAQCLCACPPTRTMTLLLVFVLLTSAQAAFVGVNLGAWLVMEDWMLPEYFWDTSPPDEHGLIQRKGGNTNADAIAFMQVPPTVNQWHAIA